MTSLFSRLQKLNKEGTPPPWPRPATVPELRGLLLTDANAALIVECRNSLPAVLNLIEAAQYAREQSQQLIGMDDPFGSQGPPILIGANAWFELADALAVFVAPEGDRSTMSGQECHRDMRERHAQGRVALRELQMTDGIAKDILATRAAEGACPLCGVARPDCEHVVWAKGVSGQEAQP